MSYCRTRLLLIPTSTTTSNNWIEWFVFYPYSPTYSISLTWSGERDRENFVILVLAWKMDFSGLVFEVNGERYEVAEVDPSTTLLDFLRSSTPFKSLKLGCGEGALPFSLSLSVCVCVLTYFSTNISRNSTRFLLLSVREKLMLGCATVLYWSQSFAVVYSMTCRDVGYMMIVLHA